MLIPVHRLAGAAPGQWVGEVEGGGGGGSFVALADNTPLVVAGGGGGGAHRDSGLAANASSLRDISDSGGGSNDRGYAGAGFTGNGSGSLAFVNGARGAVSTSGQARPGGFGGGGAGINDIDGISEDRGGGGGGYRGGAGRFLTSGGGGYSFVNTDSPYNGAASTLSNGSQGGDGSVTLTFVN